MAKGNRTINLYKDDIWKDVFYNSVGTYVNVINLELSQEYPLEPLSDYIKIGGGYAFKTSEYKKSGIPIIRISDFNNEQIDISNCVFYDEDKSLEKYELNENDIIICLTGGTIAKLGIVQSGLGKLYMNQRVGRFDILNNSKFEKEYVYWIARSVQSIIKNLAWGAAIPNVSPKQIEKLEFSFPPVNVQIQIIEFLNDLKNNTIQNKVYFNESIENHIIELQNNNIALKGINSELTHQLDLIKQLRQAFLREGMQGKLLTSVRSSAVEKQATGHELVAKIKAEKAQLIAEKKLKKEKELPPITAEEIPFEIPEHWAWCRLGEISNIQRGSSPRPKGDSRYFAKSQTSFNWITISDISSFCEGNKLKQTKEHLTEEGSKHSRFVDENEFIIAVSGSTTGKCCLTGINGYIYDGLAVVKQINKNLPSEFLMNYMTYLYAHINNSKSGASFPNINTDFLNNLIYPLPPLHEQEQIVAKLEELMAFCDGLEQSIKESQGYNEMLLQQVLREALQGEK